MADHLAFIGLGSNLSDPIQQVERALDALSRIANTELVACSSLYQSAAIGPEGQPDYINAVASLNTRLAPESLLNELQTIEHKQGRQRSIKWGARTLDLDLLLFDNQVIHTERLSVPHPHLLDRDFVVVPLYEIAPTLLLPNGDPLSGWHLHYRINTLKKVDYAQQ